MICPTAASEAVEAPAAEMADDAEMGESETAAEPWRPRPGGATSRAGRTIGRSSANSTRPSAPRSFASPRNLIGCAAISTSSFHICRASSRGLPNRLQRLSVGAAKPLLGIRPRRRAARSVAARRASSSIRCIRLSFKREKDTDFRDTVVTLLLDNSGSMRGRPITVAATCADILARTLERCGVKVEILWLHHPGLEGRPIARIVARGRQTAQSGAAQRSAPHHLQGRRRALAPRPEKSRPDDARGPAQGKHRRRGARLGAQAAAGPARDAENPDDDFRWRAGRRFHAVRSIPAIISNATCAG